MDFNRISQFSQKVSRNKHFKYGLPFMLFMVVGAIGLREFTSIRYEFSKGKWFTEDQIADMGAKIKKRGEVTLETEFEKIKKVDIDSWENIRGPRPWEENFDVK